MKAKNYLEIVIAVHMLERIENRQEAEKKKANACRTLAISKAQSPIFWIFAPFAWFFFFNLIQQIVFLLFKVKRKIFFLLIYKTIVFKKFLSRSTTDMRGKYMDWSLMIFFFIF